MENLVLQELVDDEEIILVTNILRYVSLISRFRSLVRRILFSQRRIRKRFIFIRAYLEIIVPRFSDDQFIAHFRMSRTTFQVTKIYAVQASNNQ